MHNIVTSGVPVLSYLPGLGFISMYVSGFVLKVTIVVTIITISLSLFRFFRLGALSCMQAHLMHGHEPHEVDGK